MFFHLSFGSPLNIMRFKGYLISPLHVLKSSLNKYIFLSQAIAIPSSTITPSSGGEPFTTAKTASQFFTFDTLILINNRSIIALLVYCACRANLNGRTGMVLRTSGFFYRNLHKYTSFPYDMNSDFLGHLSTHSLHFRQSGSKTFPLFL